MSLNNDTMLGGHKEPQAPKTPEKDQDALSPEGESSGENSGSSGK